MDFDPYATLGVDRSVGAAALKTAYRRRVQTAHPDRGGDPDAFMAVVRAFGLLSDPEARKLYDETGIVDEDGVKTWRRDVAILLSEMFDAAVTSAVATGLKLERVDFIAQMSTAVKNGQADAKTALARADRESDALGALRGRIRRDGAGENLFAGRIDTQLAERDTRRAILRRRLFILDSAMVELGNYRSEVELIAALEAG